MVYALCLSLCFAGHIVRDGWPALHSTHLARFVGGFLCLGGALAVRPDWHAAVIGGAIWAGFYADSKHGEGQGAAEWRDVPFLVLSGVTSVLPLAAVAAWLHWPWGAGIALAGLLKPAIWFGASALLSHDETRTWATYSRIAAGLFGALVGGLVVITLA